MRVGGVVTVLIISTAMLSSQQAKTGLAGDPGLAQSAPAAPCPTDYPVDDIIAEMHKQQSKKNSRNTNPLPQNICILGWCRGTPLPQAGPRVEAPPTPETSGSGSASSSKTPQDACLEAMDRVLDAAHNVEVGDFSFENKRYNAALLRYQDANKEKPGDLAIHVRLGRAFERLNRSSQAIEQYQAAEKLQGPQKWAEEASKARARLQRPAQR